MKTLQRIIILMCAGLLLVSFTACEQQGPAERAGEKVDEATEETGEQVNEAGEEVEETMKETTE